VIAAPQPKVAGLVKKRITQEGQFTSNMTMAVAQFTLKLCAFWTRARGKRVTTGIGGRRHALAASDLAV